VSPGSRSPFADAAVAAGYEDWYATPWGRLADELEQRMILELLEPLAPPARILDVGCGTGHFAAFLAGRGFRVAGVDAETAMLARARARAPALRADARRLPFRAGAFDGALCVSVLEYAGDPAAVLREARRVARERIAVLALDARSYLALRRRLAGLSGHAIFRRVVPRTRRELFEASRRAGAEPERARSALYLPPALGARLPGLERRLAATRWPLGGILGWSLAGSGAALR
jgi:ubiquinone/menaquinone biosynthesis C-methylase UbiE